MKKIIAILLALLLCLSAFACARERKRKEGSVVGTWDIYGAEMGKNADAAKAEALNARIEEMNRTGRTIRYCFDTDGTGSYYSTENDPVMRRFTYEIVDGSILRIKSTGGRLIETAFSLNASSEYLTMNGVVFRRCSEMAVPLAGQFVDAEAAPETEPAVTTPPAAIETETPELIDETESESPELESVTPTPPPTEPPTPTPPPTEPPTPTPTVPPTPPPTPTPTTVPSTFSFGGTTVYTGQTAVEIKGKKDSIIRITPEEMDLLIKLCPNLTDLNLYCCCMPDYARIGELTSLKRLRIEMTTHEKDTGIPLVNIDWIAELTNLTYLNLAENRITDIRAIAELGKLEELNLGHNDLDNGDLEWLSGLPRLKKVVLYNIQAITDVTPLASILTLETIHVGGNKKLANVEPLKALPNLRDLNVSYCPIGSLTQFRDFYALETLRIYRSAYVDNAYYFDLTCIPGLKKVVIHKDDTEIREALEDVIDTYGWYDLEIELTDAT